MAQSIIIHALVEKRAELSGAILELERQAKQARADLLHIDATLMLFDPDIRPHAIRAKQPTPQRLSYFEAGEMSRTCREVIRDAKGEPVSTEQIVAHVMAAKGLDLGDAKLHRELMKRFLWTLHSMLKAGSVQKVGHGLGARWMLAVDTWTAGRLDGT